MQDLTTDFTGGLCARKAWWHPPWAFTVGEHNQPDKEYRLHNCTGEVIRMVCNFGVGDLPDLWFEGAEERCFTANKFNIEVDPVAVVCHAKHIVELTRDLYAVS